MTNQLSQSNDKRKNVLAKPWDDPTLFGEREVHWDGLRSSFVGIVFAGAAYAACLWAIFGFYGIGAATSFSELAAGLVAWVFYLLVISSFGGLVACLAACLAIPFIAAFNWSLGFPLNARSASISAGSLAGYISTAFAFLGPVSFDFLGPASVYFFFGPIVCMVFGAFGAAWSSKTFGRFNHGKSETRPKGPLTTRHLFAITTWIAVTFAITNLFGGFNFAVLVSIWFLLHSLMLAIVNTHRNAGDFG